MVKVLTDDELRDYLSRGLKDAEIAQIVGFHPSTIGKRRRRLGIPRASIKGVPKDYMVCALDVPLEGYAEEAFIGHMIGDGYLQIPKKGRNATGSFAHSQKQREYFMHKYKLFEPICAHWTEKENRDKRTGVVYYSVFTYHPTNLYLSRIHSMFYRGRTKVLTPEILEKVTDVSLAFLYMDDGFLHQTGGYYIALDNFTDHELQLMQVFLQAKYDISSRPHKGNRLYISKYDASKFEAIVRPHIIPSMQYKLHPEVLTKPCELLETPEVDNQQPNLTSNSSEGSTTTDNVAPPSGVEGEVGTSTRNEPMPTKA